MEQYNHKAIEAKWQKTWGKTNLYKTPAAPRPGKKQYILDMFPYPSGAGLHVGHVEGYTATDIYSRFKRMQGFDVLHPMGWDAFGLPAENFAISSGVHPRESTNRAIAMFRKQIQAMGLSYDWEREIGTHTPDYYKWSQWIFTFLFTHDLVYRANASVNWCPSCKTTLANEQVIQGACERCTTIVFQKEMEQWFIRITRYADRLLADLDKIDWPESTKMGQRNWIGKKEGIDITYRIAGIKRTVACWTSRPDTNFGATFIVLSPEHPLATTVSTHGQQASVDAYVRTAKKKRQLERIAAGRKKTGVFTGRYAINDLTQAKMPIWVSDFVLMEFGTGAVVGVPGHDKRDFAFATTFGLPIKRVVIGKDGDASPITRIEQVQEEEGTMVNSQFLDGLDIHRATEKIMDFLVAKGQGKRKTTYHLRDWLISRQRYWGAPIPIVYDPDGKPHAVAPHDLPVLLPDNVTFEPTGKSPLSTSRAFQAGVEEKYGKGWRREVDTMDTFMDSNWYFFRFTDPHNEHAFASKDAMARWLPVDLYMGGAEHTVLHLLYARFLTKVFFDHGLIAFDEPFMKLCHQGTILGEDSRKMSKRFENVVDPMDVVKQYGADALRLFEMFLGPLDVMKPWNSKGIIGLSRFLQRVWRMGTSKKFQADSIQDRTQRLVGRVTSDVENLRFNTAIAKMMEVLNDYDKNTPTKGEWGTFLRLLAPFAPHITEELWERLRHKTSIHTQAWPKAVTVNVEQKTIIVQVNGKLRGTLRLPTTDAEKQEVVEIQARQMVQKYVSGKPKVIFVKGRIINFVVG